MGSVLNVHYLLDLLFFLFDWSTPSRDGFDAFSLVAFRPFKPALGAALYSTSLVVPHNFLNSEDVTTIDVTFSDVSFADVTVVDVIIFDVYKLWRHICLH